MAKNRNTEEAANAKLSTLGLLVLELMHEVSSPISAIDSNVKALKKIAQSSQVNTKAILLGLNKITKYTSHLIHLINTIKKYSFNDTNTKAQLCDLFDILALSKELCQTKLRLHNVTLDTDLVKPKMIYFKCKSNELAQVFINLISNSIDAIKDLDEKWIKIQATAKGGNIKITVTDSGKNIEKELQNKIFDRFFTTKSHSEGTGLGLSICKRIVKKHNGSINLNIKSKNTEFIIVLPKNTSPSQDSKS